MKELEVEAQEEQEMVLPEDSDAENFDSVKEEDDIWNPFKRSLFLNGK